MFSGSLWMILATAALNLSMVLYHRLMSQGLGDGYAELSALSALTNVLAVVTMGASTTLVKAFAEDEAAGGPSAARGRMALILPWLVKAMLAAALLLGLLTPFVTGYLKLKSPWPYFFVAAGFTFNLGILAARSAVQGTQRFGALGLSLASEGAARVGFSALLVGLGLGVAGALAGSVLAQFAGLSFCLLSIRGLGPATAPPPRHLGQGLREMGKDAAALGLFSLLCYLDVFLVKHQLEDGPASMYGRAALVAKSFLYLGAALNMVLLPAVSSARASGGEAKARRSLLGFLGAALAIDLAGLAFVWAFTPLVIRILCGADPAFQGLAPLIRVFSAAVIPLALSQLALYYLLAARDYRALWALSAVAAAYAGFLQGAHGEAMAVVRALAAASGILLAALLALAFGAKRARTA
jgi:O-antigen/teichoic acid export membrane protein